MIRVFSGIFLVALTTLLMELILIRVFDVIFYANMSYMIVTCTLFAFGLSGVYITLRPLNFSGGHELHQFLSKCSFWFAVLTLLILPVTNILPLNYLVIGDEPFRQLAYFSILYATLTAPFFVAGLMIAVIFSSYPRKIQVLYFFDLTGAAFGCIVLLPLLPLIGPGGLLFFAASLALIAGALFTPQKNRSLLLAVASFLVIMPPLIHMPDIYEFVPKIDKRHVKSSYEKQQIEFTRWDPVSKIDVIDELRQQPVMKAKHIAYDGGSQSSTIFPFDGDFEYVRENFPGEMSRHFWHRGVPVSHYLKRDSGQRVLVIGSAAGQETLAALLFNAAHVDAVEMVGTVVELGLNEYAHYNGNIFNHPDVTTHVDEGRSFLRGITEKYDIIQMQSNHTSSSMAAGNGAMATVYLQTAEAYQEYFEHLKEDGILHINHHYYPKMITTAALAWKRMGMSDFQRHVVVFVQDVSRDTLPTLLIKMSPWTVDEIQELKEYFSAEFENDSTYLMPVNPLEPESSFLPAVFYSGEFPEDLIEKMEYRIAPSTDDKPYFKFIRKKIAPITADASRFTTPTIATKLNEQLKGGFIPMDVIHLIVTGIVSLFFAILFIVLPLRFSLAGKADWPYKYSSLTYFSCLGFGFIVIELVFIQIFMKFIGAPLYTYSTVIFSLLLAAGLGSILSHKIGISIARFWQLPFIGILAFGTVFLLSYPSLFYAFLSYPLIVRMLVSMLVIFPLGIFLGMPFPLGILAVENRPTGAIAWGWGMNGLFTVIGGLFSVISSIYLGFHMTLVIALFTYGVAFVEFIRIRSDQPVQVLGIERNPA